jgi:hypothetical protein
VVLRWRASSSIRGRIFVSARFRAGSGFKWLLCFVSIDVRRLRVVLGGTYPGSRRTASTVSLSRATRYLRASVCCNRTWRQLHLLSSCQLVPLTGGQGVPPPLLDRGHLTPSEKRGLTEPYRLEDGGSVHSYRSDDSLHSR